MKLLLSGMLLAAGLVVSQASLAQAPADAPAGTTGLCKDGTYYSGATKKGACRGHKGVQAWYAGDATAAAPAAPAAPTAPATPAVAAAPAAPPAPAAAPVPVAPAAPPAPMAKAAPAAATGTPAPGGGPGMVWVNTKSNVYHCPGTKYYGQTKAGSYMSEADAKAKGAHADHGKACS